MYTEKKKKGNNNISPFDTKLFPFAVHYNNKMYSRAIKCGRANIMDLCNIVFPLVPRTLKNYNKTCACRKKKAKKTKKKSPMTGIITIFIRAVVGDRSDDLCVQFDTYDLYFINNTYNKDSYTIRLLHDIVHTLYIYICTINTYIYYVDNIYNILLISFDDRVYSNVFTNFFFFCFSIVLNVLFPRHAFVLRVINFVKRFSFLFFFRNSLDRTTTITTDVIHGGKNIAIEKDYSAKTVIKNT